MVCTVSLEREAEGPFLALYGGSEDLSRLWACPHSIPSPVDRGVWRCCCAVIEVEHDHSLARTMKAKALVVFPWCYEIGIHCSKETIVEEHPACELPKAWSVFPYPSVYLSGKFPHGELLGEVYLCIGVQRPSVIRAKEDFVVHSGNAP